MNIATGILEITRATPVKRKYGFVIPECDRQRWLDMYRLEKAGRPPTGQRRKEIYAIMDHYGVSHNTAFKAFNDMLAILGIEAQS